MVNLNLTNFLDLLRANVRVEIKNDDTEDQFMASYDRALAATLLHLVDGDTAPEPKKRTYTRKPKQSTSTPPAE